jgi:hypothetical protein
MFSFLAALTEVIRTEKASKHPYSYTFAFLYLILLSLFPVGVCSYYLYKKSKTIENQYVVELYKDLKKTHISKLFHFYFILRRIIIVLLVVTLKDINTNKRISIFTSFQILAFLYVVMFRPFESDKDNIIETVNEGTYIILGIQMLAINKVHLNGDLFAMPMVHTVMANGAVVMLIMYMGPIVYILKNAMKKWWVGKEKIKIQTLPNIKAESKIIVLDYANNNRFKLEPGFSRSKLESSRSSNMWESGEVWLDHKRDSQLFGRVNSTKTINSPENIYCGKEHNER